MNWKFWQKEHPEPSPAHESIVEGEKELREARALHSEAKKVGQSLTESLQANHFLPSLEAVMRGRHRT